MALSLRIPGSRLVAGAIVVAIALAAGSATDAQQTDQPGLRFFRIGTGSSDGSYFPIGGLIASAISNPPGARPCDQGGSCGVPGLIAVAQATRGSVENLELIGKGQLESGLSQANIALEAYNGGDRFAKTPIKKLRAIAGLYREAIHIVVRADSNIHSITQLRGKRIAVGEEGSGTLVDAQAILDAYGVPRNKVEFRFLKPGQASDMLKARQIDAFFVVAGAPALTVVELADKTPLRLLSVTSAKFAVLHRAHPTFARIMIPAGSYKGVGEVPAVGVTAIWVTSAEQDEKLIYGVTKALWNDNAQKLLESGGAEGKQIVPATALAGIEIPLHPGAERFYREAGIIKDKDARTDDKATPTPPKNAP